MTRETEGKVRLCLLAAHTILHAKEADAPADLVETAHKDFDALIHDKDVHEWAMDGAPTWLFSDRADVRH